MAGEQREEESSALGERQPGVGAALRCCLPRWNGTQRERGAAAPALGVLQGSAVKFI